MERKFMNKQKRMLITLDEFYMAAAFEIYAITNLNGLINKTHNIRK